MNLAASLLDWYDRHRRSLPWRAAPGARSDPYRVWLSEIMLQQTTVAAVKSYFEAFVARWPTVSELAAASLDDVLQQWQGLGYYSRARNIHACARKIAEVYQGRFPASESALRQLPGIGPYTAAAVAAIAFGAKATAMDGNVERVVARLRAVVEPLPDAKPVLRRLAGELTPDERPGDYAQAVMDLGATICTPRKPRCVLCPWASACRAGALGIAEELPARRARAARPTRRGVAFVAMRADGAILLRKRPERGLLGGMMELPSTEWRAQPWGLEEALTAAPISGSWRKLPGVVRHTFSHFRLELEVVLSRAEGGEGVWAPLERMGEHALPTVMRKVIEHALRAG